MKDYENFVARMGSFDMELTPPETDQDLLNHFGVKGMKWGVRKNRPEGVSARTNRQAKKDAKEFTKAKMYYGEGAGTRRKLIKSTVEARAKKDPSYKKAFDAHVENTDFAKRSKQAVSQRRSTDTKNAVAKTGKQVSHALRGNSQYAGFGAIAIAAAGTYAWQNGGGDFIRQNGSKAISKVVREINIAKGRKAMKRYLQEGGRP